MWGLSNTRYEGFKQWTDGNTPELEVLEEGDVHTVSFILDKKDVIGVLLRTKSNDYLYREYDLSKCPSDPKTDTEINGAG